MAVETAPGVCPQDLAADSADEGLCDKFWEQLNDTMPSTDDQACSASRRLMVSWSARMGLYGDCIDTEQGQPGSAWGCSGLQISRMAQATADHEHLCVGCPDQSIWALGRAVTM